MLGYGDASTGYALVLATPRVVEPSWLYDPPRNVAHAADVQELLQKPFVP